MKIITTAAEIKEITTSLSQHKTIGFVPTMGALHKGHLALINKSKKLCDVTVCSIFINPAQFNNSTDFEKYPITIDADIALLKSIDCNILYMPTVVEMYPPNFEIKIFELGFLDQMWEALYRTGHFQGVCKVMDRFLDIIYTHHLWMGQKDYQQCLVVMKLLEITNRKNILFHRINTIREKSGLALSSRNKRLSIESKKNATALFDVLKNIKEQFQSENFTNLCRKAKNYLLQHGFDEVEYVAIVDAETLLMKELYQHNHKYVAIAAAWINGVRLIDNLLL